MGGKPAAADVGDVGKGALSDSGVAVALVGQLADSTFQLLHVREVQAVHNAILLPLARQHAELLLRTLRAIPVVGVRP